MFDIVKKEWSREILEMAELDSNLLPEAQPAGTMIGQLTFEAAKETDLSERTLVVTGGHDQACGALGAGIVESGPAMDATGTVECIGVILKTLSLSKQARVQGFAVHHYVIEDKYFLFGFNPTSGVILRWFRDNFAEKEREEAKKKSIDIYDLLTSMAAESPLGAKELFLLPYFEGSGTPTFNRKARGVFLGLTLAHSKNEVLRAILEGLSYELRTNIEAIEKLRTEITEIRAIGGGARSDFWSQLKADITGKPLVVPNVTEAAALGAAILAGVGAELYKSVEEAVKAVYKEKSRFSPRVENIKRYDRYYNVYGKIYEPLIKIFNEIYELAEEI